jgi:hypothetical protein
MYDKFRYYIKSLHGCHGRTGIPPKMGTPSLEQPQDRVFGENSAMAGTFVSSKIHMLMLGGRSMRAELL